MGKARVDRVPELLQDPKEFISRLCIMHKQKQRLHRFELNRAQLELIDALKTHNRIIVLKARQLGISTLTRAWHFYQAYMADQPRQFAVISHTRPSAEELHRIEKTFYENLPSQLRKPLARASVRTLRFADSGAQLRTYTASGRGGARSYAMNSAHLSEFAFYEKQEETMATVMAAVGDGQVIIESTPNVHGDMFHNLVQGALEGTNEWKLVFFPWYMHDAYRSDYDGNARFSERDVNYMAEFGLERDQMLWRRKQIRTLGKSKFQREYPATVDECFRSSSTQFFSPKALAKIEPVDLGSREHRCYLDPIEGDSYVMGVDVGAGLGGDYSAITIASVSTRQPVYHYLDNRISPVRLAEKILDFWARYNRCQIIVESNNHGHLVLHRLRELKVKNLYKENDKDFMTTAKTRPLLYGALREAVESNMILSLDQNVIEELKAIVYLNGKPQSPKNGFDDATMSMALCYYLLSRKPLKVTHSIRKAVMEEYIKKQRAKSARRALPWNVTGGNNKGGWR